MQNRSLASQESCAVVAQPGLEHSLGKGEVTSSILVNGSSKFEVAKVAQLVERRYRKPQVASSILALGSNEV